MIDITGVDLVAFVKKVYELSVPQGLGILHFVPGSLTDEEAKSLIMEDDPRIIVDMDYVGGRACKMMVYREGEHLMIRDSWYDHTDSQLKQLLDFCKISIKRASISPQGHGCACNCDTCNRERSMKPSPN